MGEENAANVSWQETVPEFARDWNQVKESATPEDFFNRVGEMRSHIGQSVRIPGQDASSEDMQGFYQKLQDKVPGLMPTPDLENQESINEIYKRLGRPDAVDGYTDVSGDEMAFNDGQMAELKGLAHDLGLTKKQFEHLASKVGGENFNNNSGLQDKLNENSKVLQEKWGLSAEAKYQETVNFAEQANAPKQLIEGLKARQIDSETVLWLSGLAQSVSEKTQVSFQGNNANGSAITPDEAHLKIDEILNNPEHPYHRGDEGARRRYHDLLRQANPQNYQ